MGKDDQDREQEKQKKDAKWDRGKRRMMSWGRMDEGGERRTGEDCVGREVQQQQQAEGMFHMPVLWMTWPPWSVGDTGSN